MKIIYFILYSLYALLSPFLSLLGLVFLLYKKRKDPPYGLRALELLGVYRKRFRSSIVFHTVSVGEVIAARPLIEEFAKKNININIIVTTTTTTGALEARKISHVTHVFAPLDSYLGVKLFFKSFNPRFLFIMETELWPNLLNLAHKNNTRVCIFNARMPAKTYHSYLKFKGFYNYIIFSHIDYVLAQTDDDVKYFTNLGIGLDYCVKTGSIKYDLKPNDKLFKQALGIKEQLKLTKVFGAVSTHDGEEELVLESFLTVRQEMPDLKLVLVPRHKSSVELAIKFLKERQIDFNLKTSLKGDLSDFTSGILVGNTIGEIELYLGLCDMVFMGGSFVDVGGHNPLEPAYFSLPVITGPFYYNFTEQFEKLIEHKGAFLAPDHRRLCNLLLKFFSDMSELKCLGLNALDVQEQGRGALAKSLGCLEKIIKG